MEEKRARLRSGELKAGEIAFSTFTKPADLPADATPADLAAWAIVARVLLNLDDSDAVRAAFQSLQGSARTHEVPFDGVLIQPMMNGGVETMIGVVHDRLFGPIIGIQKVAGDDEAVRLMNDTRYGLTAGVYTPDEARARRLLAQVNAGSVYWNCCDRVSPRLPWSGVGDSGVGLTLSTYGIETFTRPKAWHLRKA